MPRIILAERVHIGQGVVLSENITLSAPDGGKAKSITIEDFAVLENDVSIRSSEIKIGNRTKIEKNFTVETGPSGGVSIGDGVFLGADGHAIIGCFFVGDYTRIHNHVFIHGPGAIHIGHNVWVGGNCVLDGQGELFIDDNVGIGAQSQLWSHIQFGDVLAGCRFYSKKPLIVESDVWFVGHCIVSPIRARRRSMALVGSVVTGDMEENHVYAGVPAKDVTDKLGPQFSDPTPDERMKRMKEYLDEFYASHPNYKERSLLPVLEYDPRQRRSVTQFHLMERTYSKRGTDQEREFMSWITPTRAKFLPRDWVSPLNDFPIQKG